MKIDNYCVLLILLVLFLFYINNTNKVEGYAEIGKAPVQHKKETDEQPYYEGTDEGEGNERIVQDYEVVGQKPQKVTMGAPRSMIHTMGTLMGAPVHTGDMAADDYMLIGKDQGVYSAIGADLPSPYPRVGAPDNLGQDTDFVSKLLEDNSSIGSYSGETTYHEFGEGGEGEGGEGGVGEGEVEYEEEDRQPRAQKAQQSPGGELRVVIIYAPWCGWSKKSLPDFKKMDTKLNSLSDAETNGWAISAEVYNSDKPEGKEKVKEYEVEGFPSVVVEVNGQKQEGPRDYDEMIELVNSITGANIN